jgi:putative transposase
MQSSERQWQRQDHSDRNFNSTLRDKCLGMGWLRTRAKAMVVIEQWRQDYDTVRPLSSWAIRVR